MKDAKDQLVLIPGKDTIPESLGISPERRIEMQKKISQICKEEMGKDDGTHKDVIKRVYDEFENPNECTFALYILTHAEEDVAIHEVFSLPENVGEEVDN